MKEVKKIFFFLSIVMFAVGCDTETAICNVGEPAKLYYTPNCSTINGYIILDSNNKTFVFQHEIDERFQNLGVEVCIEYQIEESRHLTAECAMGEIIKIISISER